MDKRVLTCAIVGVVLVVSAGAAGAASSAALRCQAGKNKAAGKYSACRQNAEAKFVTTGDMAKYTAAVAKCEATFTQKWAKLEQRASDAGASCPDAGLTGAQYETVIDECTDNMATALSGGGMEDWPAALATCNASLATCQTSLTPALACGNGTIDAGEQCDQGNLNGQTCRLLGFAGGTLACGGGCTFDTSGCWTAACAASGPAPSTLDCGAAITTDVTLDADIGPCPGDGVSIPGPALAGPPVTVLNLNGHSIIGSGTGSGITIRLGNGAVTVKGPGQITNFGTGINIDSRDNLLIHDLNLNQNTTGIYMYRSSPSPSEETNVFNNTILGGGTGQVGIYVLGSNVHVYQNTIVGHSVVGIAVGPENHPLIEENVITQNQAGIIETATSDYACFTLRSNRIVNNKANGFEAPARISPLSLSPLYPMGPCFAIEGNDISSNGGSGIVVVGRYDVLIRDNMVRNNQINGISLTGPYGSNQVIGNRAQDNGIDLFWDSASSDNCWSQNIFCTSSPAPELFPPCQ